MTVAPRRRVERVRVDLAPESDLAAVFLGQLLDMGVDPRGMDRIAAGVDQVAENVADIPLAWKKANLSWACRISQ